MKSVTAALAAFMLIFAFAATPASASGSSRTFFAPEVCVDTEAGEACIEAKNGNVGIVCAPVGPLLCCKQVLVSSKSKGGKSCQDCEDKCDGIEDSNKRDKCFNKCEQKNEGCNGGSSSAKLTEVGDTLSCVLYD